VIDIRNISVLLGELNDVRCLKERAVITAGYVYCHVRTDAKQKCSSKLFIKYSRMD